MRVDMLIWKLKQLVMGYLSCVSIFGFIIVEEEAYEEVEEEETKDETAI